MSGQRPELVGGDLLAPDGARRSDRRDLLVRALASRPPVALGVVALAGTAVVAAVDPGEPGHYPTCPFLAVTGLWCPGCGGLRAVHALARGDVGAALGYNGLLVLALPVLAVAWLRWVARYGRTSPPAPVGPAGRTRTTATPYLLTALVVLVVLFTVARNLPVGGVLAP